MGAALDLLALKTRQQSAWSSGDYAVVGSTLQIVGETLCEALDRGQLFGVALDVFKNEPLPTTSPLLKYDNVVLCTHMGGMDHDSAIATSSLAAQCIVDLYHGRWPEACAVNRELRERWKW